MRTKQDPFAEQQAKAHQGAQYARWVHQQHQQLYEKDITAECERQLKDGTWVKGGLLPR